MGRCEQRRHVMGRRQVERAPLDGGLLVRVDLGREELVAGGMVGTLLVGSLVVRT